MRRCLGNVLAAGGEPEDHVVSLRPYLPNFRPEEAEGVAAVLTETFGAEVPPASTRIGVTGLARPEYLVEAAAAAVLPDRTRGDAPRTSRRGPGGVAVPLTGGGGAIWAVSTVGAMVGRRPPLARRGRLGVGTPPGVRPGDAGA